MWSLNLSELKRAINEARSNCIPRGIVIINPGNPTGKCCNDSRLATSQINNSLNVFGEC